MSEVSRRTIDKAREQVNYWYERNQWLCLQRDLLTVALMASITLNLILLYEVFA